MLHITLEIIIFGATVNISGLDIIKNATHLRTEKVLSRKQLRLSPD